MNIMRPARVSLITSTARPRNLFFPSHPSVHYARELRLSSETLGKKEPAALHAREQPSLCARARLDKIQGDACDNAYAASHFFQYERFIIHLDTFDI